MGTADLVCTLSCLLQVSVAYGVLCLAVSALIYRDYSKLNYRMLASLARDFQSVERQVRC